MPILQRQTISSKMEKTVLPAALERILVWFCIVAWHLPRACDHNVHWLTVANAKGVGGQRGPWCRQPRDGERGGGGWREREGLAATVGLCGPFLVTPCSAWTGSPREGLDACCGGGGRWASARAHMLESRDGTRVNAQKHDTRDYSMYIVAYNMRPIYSRRGFSLK